MLLRIFLILAIVAGLGAGGIAYYESNTQIPALKQQRDDEQTAKNTEIAAHNKTKSELKQTKGELAQTRQELSDTKLDRDKAVARADAQSKRADDLNDKLTQSQSALQDANNTVTAYKASGLSPDEVVKLNQNLLDAKKEIAVAANDNAVLDRAYKTLKSKYEQLVDPDYVITLPATMKGQVVVVDPKYDFVVLNIGADNGVLANGELLVSREGRLVAKVVIRTVEKDRCIANLIPGWKLGEVIEGDVVTPAHPAST